MSAGGGAPPSTDARFGWPVPTRRAWLLFACGLFPAVLGLALPGLAWLTLALDLGVLLACALDFVLAAPPGTLRVERVVQPVLSSGVPNRSVVLVHSERGDVHGELRDPLPQGLFAPALQAPFHATPASPAEVELAVTPDRRGDLLLADVHLRWVGPLGLCARQARFGSERHVKVYPDLTSLTRDALALARASEEQRGRVLRRPSEGREFESLREYRGGDDFRIIDWKATARRNVPLVRAYQPERNQPVLVMLDCGRHMAGRVEGRRKLDHAVDAALRLAKVSLDAGDAVGVVAFSTQLQCHLPPRRGAEHLRAMTEALYRAEASLEESDYGAALDRVLARQHRRALIVLFTDLLDPETSRSVVQRTLALRPRHLPMLVCLRDEDLAHAATRIPHTRAEAYERHVAVELEGEHRLTAARLRNAGALVLRTPARQFGAEAVNAYLQLKARGAL